jgi:transposase InsO family protein
VYQANFSQSSGVECCFLAGSSSELWKWHRKLGHLSFDLLSHLSKLNLVRGLPLLRLEKELVCAPCRHAKMVAFSHLPLTDVMTERPCELLIWTLLPSSCAICGWEVVCPCCGKRLLLVCIGGLSEKKGETFGFVRDLVLRLRNERHGDTIRAIRSDNGSKFRNSSFETFCHDVGLQHQFLSLHMPPWNGVVGRKNRTLCEMARMMLDEHRTPRRFWAEAVNTMCYVSNSEDHVWFEDRWMVASLCDE